MAAPTRAAETPEERRLVRRSATLTRQIARHLDIVRELSDERDAVWGEAVMRGVSRNQLAKASGLHHSQLRHLDAHGDRRRG